MARLMSVDVETYSEVDLKKCGAEVYARDKSTECLIFCYSIGGRENTWLPTLTDQPPEDLLEFLNDEDCYIVAYNAKFEQLILKHVLGFDIPYSRFFDTMVLAKHCALPAALGPVSKIVGVQEKMDVGKRLIRKFSVPRKPTKYDKSVRNLPSLDDPDFKLFIEYCMGDVRAERSVFKALKRYAIKSEKDVIAVDAAINERGIPFDIPLVEKVNEHYIKYRHECLAKISAITGVDNPNSVSQLGEWLRNNGYSRGTLSAEVVEDEIERNSSLREDVREVLSLRLASSMSSAAKYDAVLRSHVDGRVYWAFNYYGASKTGRWSGRTYQPQNLPRPSDKIQDSIEEVIDDVMSLGTDELDEKWGLRDVCKSLVRPIVKSSNGVLCIADYSSIENVILGWVSREPAIINAVKRGDDLYKVFASGYFGVPYEEVTKDQRAFAKPAVLGAGYMMGGGGEIETSDGIKKTGFYGYSERFGLSLSADDARGVINAWRDMHPKVVEFWHLVYTGCIKAVLGENTSVLGLKFIMNGPFLEIHLPSGRPLRYFKPKVEKKPNRWGNLKTVLSYRSASSGMHRINVHGGLITENIVQGIARDVLAEGLVNAHREGMNIIMHVHDEIVCDEKSEDKLGLLTDCMTRLPKWADDDLTLRADGVTSERYRK